MQKATGAQLFPVTFSIAWVIGVFGISTAPLGDLWRPLLVAAVLATIWSIGAAYIGRGNQWVALAAGTVWVAAVTTWWIAAIIPALAGMRIVLRRMPPVPAGRRESTPRWTARMASTLGLALCLVGAVGVGASGAFSLPPATSSSADARAVSSGPNIYLVLLDGYPRRDTLREDFDIDNGPFVEALERLGFVVAEDSHANYPTTLLTLTSMLHMTYVEEIAELSRGPEEPTKQVRMLSTAINRSPALALLNGAGYRTVTVPSWYGEATLSAADDVRGSGHLTIFEEQVLRLSSLGQLVLGQWPNLVADQQRARTEVAFAELGRIAAEAKGPTFVLAHIFSPHAPLLFEADGSPLPAPVCYPAECSFNITEASALGMTVDEYGAALDGHLRHLNRLVTQAVTKVIEADPEAVIVLFSDHGTRYDHRDVDEHFRTFMAARTPNGGGIARQVATPVNVLPALFNGYLGADIPLREPRMWAADAGAPLEMTPLPLVEGNR